MSEASKLRHQEVSGICKLEVRSEVCARARTWGVTSLLLVPKTVRLDEFRRERKECG
jgi:hypothetical protein